MRDDAAVEMTHWVQKWKSAFGGRGGGGGGG